MTIDGQLAAGGLDVSSKGTLRLSGNQGPTAGLALKVANANLRSPRPVAAGRPAETLPVALTAKVDLAEGVVGLTEIAGKAAGTEIGGRLKIGFAPISVNGEIDLAEVDLPAAIAAAIGTPLQARNAAAIWPADPFEQGLVGRIGGRVAVRVAHVALTPRLAAKNVRAVVQFDQAELALDNIDGTLAGGRVAGAIGFERGAEGVTARARLNFAGADLAELIRGGPPPLSGRVTVGLNVEGTGRSPVALIGALKGGGTFTLQDARALRFDPASFDTVIRSVDQGLPIDAGRIRDRTEQALGGGALSIPLAEGEIAFAGGQIRLANTIVRAQGAELTLGGGALLTEDAVDVKLTLTGVARPDSPAGARPEIAVALKGPLETPKRTLDVATFANWLALRALEQQTKRIDALESGRELPVVPPGASAPPPAAPPAVTPPRAVRSEAPPKRRVIPPGTGQSAPRPLDLRPPGPPG
jgi:large subunit ribosomal protein L24